MLVQLIEEAYLREAEERQQKAAEKQSFINKIKSGASNMLNSIDLKAWKPSTNNLALIGGLTGAGLGAYFGVDNVDELNGLIGGSDIYAPVAGSAATLGAGLGMALPYGADLIAMKLAEKKKASQNNSNK